MKQNAIQISMINNSNNSNQRPSQAGVVSRLDGGRPRVYQTDDLLMMETVMNMYHVRIRKWCASCEQKEVDNEGERICTALQLKVPQNFICPKWKLAYALQQAGIQKGGVVRLKGTLEIVIH